MDPERFDLIYDEHLEAIQRYCIRRLPTSEVGDAVSEVFLVAWRRIDDAPADHVLPWLYAIARNVVRNAHRGRARRRRLQRKVDALPGEHADASDLHVVRRQEERSVLEALGRLRPGDQEVLRLRTWERLSSEQIGAVLGISPHAVDARVSRARRRLADEYERLTQEITTGGSR